MDKVATYELLLAHCEPYPATKFPGYYFFLKKTERIKDLSIQIEVAFQEGDFALADYLRIVRDRHIATARHYLAVLEILIGDYLAEVEPET